MARTATQASSATAARAAGYVGFEGDARMTGAIWSFARQFLGAAEAKVRLGRIADRPTDIDKCPAKSA